MSVQRCYAEKSPIIYRYVALKSRSFLIMHENKKYYLFSQGIYLIKRQDLGTYTSDCLRLYKRLSKMTKKWISWKLKPQLKPPLIWVDWLVTWWNRFPDCRLAELRWRVISTAHFSKLRTRYFKMKKICSDSRKHMFQL